MNKIAFRCCLGNPNGYQGIKICILIVILQLLNLYKFKNMYTNSNLINSTPKFSWCHEYVDELKYECCNFINMFKFEF